MKRRLFLSALMAGIAATASACVTTVTANPQLALLHDPYKPVKAVPQAKWIYIRCYPTHREMLRYDMSNDAVYEHFYAISGKVPFEWRKQFWDQQAVGNEIWWNNNIWRRVS